MYVKNGTSKFPVERVILIKKSIGIANLSRQIISLRSKGFGAKKDRGTGFSVLAAREMNENQKIRKMKEGLLTVRSTEPRRARDG